MASRSDTQVSVTFACFLYMHKRIRTEKPPCRFPHTAADGLFAEQVAARLGAGQRQNQYIILYAVNEQPVRENVTFPILKIESD